MPVPFSTLFKPGMLCKCQEDCSKHAQLSSVFGNVPLLVMSTHVLLMRQAPICKDHQLWVLSPVFVKLSRSLMKPLR